LAVTPQTNEAFIREVDEELRRDQLASMGRRYGLMIGGAVALVLAVLGGVLLWQNHQRALAGEQGEKFARLFDTLGSGDVKSAQAPLAELAGSSIAGYRALAQFTQADLLLQKDDLKGAAAKFAAVAADTAVGQPLRDLALIRQTSAEYDTLAPGIVVARLKRLAIKGGPWLGSAGEMVAIAHVRMNKPGLAGALFGDIAADQRVPETLRQRAVQMAGALGVDAVAQKEDNQAQ
jgi:hypothetical protein